MIRDLADEFWGEFQRAHPVSATLLGFHRHDDRLPDVTPEGRAEHRSRLGALAARLSEAPETADLEDRVTRGALQEEIGARLGELDADLESWTVDPLAGPPVWLSQLAELQRVADAEQGRALVARFRAAGPHLAAVVANLHRALGAGRVAPACAVRRVLRQVDALLAQPQSEWRMLQPAIDGGGPWEGAFRADLEAAVRSTVRPALAGLGTALAREILPRARPDEHGGLCHLPGGDAAYARMIRLHTGLELAARQVHELGLQELERVRDELRRLGERALGTADLPAILARLRQDPELHFRRRDEIEATAAAALERARDALPRLVGRLPRTECVVRRMAAYEEKDSTIAFYRPPSADGSRGGQYHVNTHAPTTRPRYEAEALAFHESIPGHHLQIALAQECDGLPEFRRQLGSTAYVEGWGLYAERLADEAGLYSGDLDRIGMLSFDGWRAARLVVDTGLHALGWSRRQAVEFLLANAALAENNVVNEVDRYIVWPGQALAYKIGQREILSLRAAAQQRAGAAFDLRAFHDRILEHGAVPLPLLRGLVLPPGDAPG